MPQIVIKKKILPEGRLNSTFPVAWAGMPTLQIIMNVLLFQEDGNQTVFAQVHALHLLHH